MRPAVTAQEMRQAEAAAAQRGLSLEALMQLAAHGAAERLLAREVPGSDRYLVLAGPGNNGGDALVVADLLHAAGKAVQVFTYHRRSPSPVDPAGIRLQDLASAEGNASFPAALTWCDVLVDGILGTGQARALAPDLAAILSAVNGAPHRPFVVALDLPTGVDAGSGGAGAATLRADETLTFGYVKRGLLLYPARGFCGAVRLIDVGLPSVPVVTVAAWQPEPRDIARRLPRRTPTTHKYTAGAVLAVAGSPQYVGAPVLATTAALRAGAGYVTLAAPSAVVERLATRLLETTMLTLPGDPVEAVTSLHGVASRYHALLIGPGLGRSDEITRLVMGCLSGALQGPHVAVVDADALAALSHVPEWWKKMALPIVLTPHTGEMARLTGLDAGEIESDRPAVAQRFAREWNQVVVLKGAPTIVASPEGVLSINPTGNPLLATAGSGDVLSGVIGALAAGGMPAFDAAVAGVFVHGLAADMAVPAFGDRGMVAGDLFDYLPRAFQHILGHGEHVAGRAETG